MSVGETLWSKYLIYALLPILALSIPTFSVSGSSSELEVVRVIVGVSPFFARGPRDFEFSRIVEELSAIGKLDFTIPEIGAVVLEVTYEELAQIASLPYVEYVEKDEPVYRILSTEITWNVRMVNATRVWAMSNTYGNAAYGQHTAITVAVLDTGVDSTHAELRDAVVYCIVSLRDGRTFYRGTNLAYCADRNGHGTHAAGIIAARLNNFGMVGVAPRVAIYAVKVLDDSGSGYISDIARGIVESVKGPDGVPGTRDDADVISMSLGGPDSQTLRDAVRYAYSYGAVLVAASGNEGASSPACPACYSEVIAVGAVDSAYSVPWWSNRNPDVVAPGVSIYSTLPGGRYGAMSGTSMACPHVSAAVAIVQAMRLARGLSKLPPQDMIYLVRVTAVDLGSRGYDPYFGYGLLDAYRLVLRAVGG